MLAFGLEEERVPAPDIDATLGTVMLEQLRYFSRGCNRVADQAAADMPHYVRNRTVAMDHGLDARVFGGLARFVCLEGSRCLGRGYPLIFNFLYLGALH